MIVKDRKQMFIYRKFHGFFLLRGEAPGDSGQGLANGEDGAGEAGPASDVVGGDAERLHHFGDVGEDRGQGQWFGEATYCCFCQLMLKRTDENKTRWVGGGGAKGGGACVQRMTSCLTGRRRCCVMMAFPFFSLPSTRYNPKLIT